VTRNSIAGNADCSAPAVLDGHDVISSGRHVRDTEGDAVGAPARDVRFAQTEITSSRSKSWSAIIAWSRTCHFGSRSASWTRAGKVLGFLHRLEATLQSGMPVP
jgi:hypothetical protein